MRLLKTAIFLIIGLVVIVGSLILFLKQQVDVVRETQEPIQNTTILVTIASTTVQAEVADTHASRNRGLSGRAALPDGTGMLFVFEKPDTLGFWMPDMHFSIDMIWINAAQTVIGIEKDVSPDTYPQIFQSPSETMYVLEVPAGFSETQSITVGSQVHFEYKN